MIACTDAFAWLADGQITIRDEGAGSRQITPKQARDLADVYARLVADEKVTGVALDEMRRWMLELEVAIAAQAGWVAPQRLAA